MLLDSGLLFREPDSPAVLSTGGGRHWPEGRGVFVLEPKDDSSAMTAWINEEEHFKIMVASWMNMIDLGMTASKIFLCSPLQGKSSNLRNIFQGG